MRDHTFTLTVATVGIVGTLAGIVIGHFLTRSWQREQWIMDNRRDEWRELMKALSKAYMAVGEWKPAPIMFEGDDLLNRMAISTEYLVTVSDRLFIAKEMKELHLSRLWFEGVDTFLTTKNIGDFGKAYEEMTTIIVKAATKDA